VKLHLHVENMHIVQTASSIILLHSIEIRPITKAVGIVDSNEYYISHIGEEKLLDSDTDS